MSLLKGFLIACQFLTILPIRVGFEERDFPTATIFFPVVGLFLGFFLAGIHHLGSSAFSPLTAGAFVVAGGLVLTSGLHLDGFMDTVDALASGKDPAAVLKIFKDTHTGAKSVLAVFSLLLLKFVLLVEVPKLNVYQVIIGMPILGRWLQVWAMASFPYVRQMGLGTSFIGQLRKGHLALATLLTLLIIYVLLGLPGLGVMAFSGLLTHILGCYFTKRLGGLVGDIYGAFCEGGEVLFLLVLTWYYLSF